MTLSVDNTNYSCIDAICGFGLVSHLQNSKADLKNVFSANIGDIGVKTKTSSWEGYKVAVACTLSVSFRGEIKLNRLQIIAFQIYRNIGVEDDICGKLLFSREFANRRIHA